MITVPRKRKDAPYNEDLVSAHASKLASSAGPWWSVLKIQFFNWIGPIRAQHFLCKQLRQFQRPDKYGHKFYFRKWKRVHAAWNRSAMTLSMAMFLTVFRKKLDSGVLVENCLSDGKANRARPIRTLLKGEMRGLVTQYSWSIMCVWSWRSSTWSGCRGL